MACEKLLLVLLVLPALCAATPDEGFVVDGNPRHFRRSMTVEPREKERGNAIRVDYDALVAQGHIDLERVEGVLGVECDGPVDAQEAMLVSVRFWGARDSLPFPEVARDPATLVHGSSALGCKSATGAQSSLVRRVVAWEVEEGWGDNDDEEGEVVVLLTTEPEHDPLSLFETLSLEIVPEQLAASKEAGHKSGAVNFEQVTGQAKFSLEEGCAMASPSDLVIVNSERVLDCFVSSAVELELVVGWTDDSIALRVAVDDDCDLGLFTTEHSIGTGATTTTVTATPTFRVCAFVKNHNYIEWATPSGVTARVASTGDGCAASALAIQTTVPEWVSSGDAATIQWGPAAENANCPNLPLTVVYYPAERFWPDSRFVACEGTLGNGKSACAPTLSTDDRKQRFEFRVVVGSTEKVIGNVNVFEDGYVLAVERPYHNQLVPAGSLLEVEWTPLVDSMTADIILRHVGDVYVTTWHLAATTSTGRASLFLPSKIHSAVPYYLDFKYDCGILWCTHAYSDYFIIDGSSTVGQSLDLADLTHHLSGDASVAVTTTTTRFALVVSLFAPFQFDLDATVDLTLDLNATVLQPFDESETRRLATMESPVGFGFSLAGLDIEFGVVGTLVGTATAHLEEQLVFTASVREQFQIGAGTHAPLNASVSLSDVPSASANAKILAGPNLFFGFKLGSYQYGLSAKLLGGAFVEATVGSEDCIDVQAGTVVQAGAVMQVGTLGQASFGPNPQRRTIVDDHCVQLDQ